MTSVFKRPAFNRLWIIPVIVLSVILIDVWYGMQRYQTYRNFQLKIMHDEVVLIANDLEAQLLTMNTQTKLFADMFSLQISSLASNPSNTTLQKLLQERMEYMLSGAMNFNISMDHSDDLLINNHFERSENIASDHHPVDVQSKHFEVTHLEINKRNNNYHFDIEVEWVFSPKKGDFVTKSGRFRVSYHTGDLSYTLSKNINKQNTLYLMQDNLDGEIDITSSGSRSVLRRDLKLSDNERLRVAHSQQVEGTRWILVSLYPEGFFESELYKIVIEVFLLAIAIVFVFILLSKQIRQQRLRAQTAEIFLSNIIDNIPGVVFRAELPIDGDMHYSYISLSAEVILGYSAQEIALSPSVLFKATHEDDFSELFDKMQESAVNLSPLRHEYRINRKDGSYLWVRQLARPVKEENGDIAWSGLLLDISDLKAFEQKLLLHSSALNASANGILICNERGVVEWVNPALIKLFGYLQENLLNQNVMSLIDASSGNKDEMHQAINGQKNFNNEMICVTEARHAFSADITLTPVLKTSGKVGNFVVIIRDLSSKKVLETQLIQAQKMESVGQLAAGIAHEINTPTQFVGDNVHFLKDVISDSLEVFSELEVLEQKLLQQKISFEQIQPLIHQLIEKADLEFIKQEAPLALDQSLDGLARIAKIVGAMKDFSHPGSIGMDNVDINHIIETTVTIARNEWKYVAQLEMDLASDLPTIPADSQLIGQTLLNFIVNAAHAIENKKSDEQFEGLISIKTSLINDGVEIRIADNGAGIPDAIKDRIFEPFFTTKEVGKGSGQGLAIAYSGIVDKHKGSIRIESEVGKGTTFIVLLPLSIDPSEA